MKTRQIVGIVALVVILAAGVILYLQTRSDHVDAISGHAAAEEYYTCPMHPSVRSDRPGACPVCGMALVKKSGYTPPSIQSDDPGGITLSPNQQVVANVSTCAVTRGTLTKEIRAVGLVSYAEPLQATVAARFRGRIEKLHADFTGEVVKKGDPLFELYSPDLLSAEREFVLSVERTEDSIARGNLSGLGEMQRQLLEAARERLRDQFGVSEEQIAHLEHSREVRSTAVFLSPISGTVIQKQVLPGQYVDEGMVLYQIADLSEVWVFLDVYEKDLSSINVGQVLTIESESYPGESFKGKVTFVDPFVNPETRTVRVRTEFRNPDGKLKPNMFLSATVEREIRNALIVPAGAILSTGKKDVVWVSVGPNRFEPREVVRGASNDASVEILEGLVEGEMIAVTGGYLIDSESALQIPANAAHEVHEGGVHGESRERSADTSLVREINIRVAGSYSPDVVHLKKGVPAKLIFLREDSQQCTEEVVLSDFGERVKLPKGERVVLDLKPGKTGEFVFSCGMNMIHGKIVVHE